MKGRPPTPLALLKSRGSRLDRREGEPETTPIAPEQYPPWLSATAREHWMRLVPMLQRMNVLMESDGDALAALCEAIALYILSRDDVAKNGLTTHGENGGEFMRPQVRIMGDAWKRILDGCREFGLTPSARGRVKCEPKKATGIASRARG